MNYIPCTDQSTPPFWIPASIADSHLKLATGTQLKVLLYYMRNMQSGITEEAVAQYFKLPLSEVIDALEFWVQAGVLISIVAPAVSTDEKTLPAKTKPVKSAVVKPAREEIAAIAATDEQLSILIQEAEMKFARALRQSEISTLAWLYLDLGMNASVILMLVEYAISVKSATTSFVEKTAVKWIEAGIDSIEKADEEISAMTRRRTAWGIIASAYGFGDRKPSNNELEYAQSWIIDWGFSREMLIEAYNRCIDQKAKIDIAYINGILKIWQKKGIKTVADIPEKDATDQKESAKKKTVKTDMGTYDKELVKKLLKKDE